MTTHGRTGSPDRRRFKQDGNIAGTGGARKARAARGGRGKSGGARIIRYVVTRRGVLYLLEVYANSAKKDLTDAEKHEIRRFVAAIEAQA